MGIPKPCHREPDRPCLHQSDVQAIMSRCRVMRCADVSSDHHLVVKSARLRLKKYPTIVNIRSRFNVSLLKNRDIQTFLQLSLTNKFQSLQELLNGNIDIESRWQQTKKIWLDTHDEVLGRNKMHHNEWISTTTLYKLGVGKTKNTTLNTSRKRAENSKAQEECTATDREVKAST